MPVFKDENKGTWYVMARYVDWTGERKQKCKSHAYHVSIHPIYLCYLVS